MLARNYGGVTSSIQFAITPLNSSPYLFGIGCSACVVLATSRRATILIPLKVPITQYFYQIYIKFHVRTERTQPSSLLPRIHSHKYVYACMFACTSNQSIAKLLG